MDIATVLVIAYNSETTVIETLNSIYHQTYQTLELIIADDASRDNTCQLCAEWIEKNKTRFHKILLLKHETNRGIPGNINDALKVVTGKYFKLLAADDILEFDAMEQYIQFLKCNARKIPIGKVTLFPEHSVNYMSVSKYCEKCYEFADLGEKEQYRELLIQNRIVAPAASCYPTALIRECSGYDERLRTMEDYPMNISVMRHGYSYGKMDCFVVKYRLSENSVTASQGEKLRETGKIFFLRKRFWYLLQERMLREAFGQLKYWLNY